jgi:hypothetical protein
MCFEDFDIARRKLGVLSRLVVEVQRVDAVWVSAAWLWIAVVFGDVQI